MTVYVPYDDGTKDLTDAKRYGNLVVLNSKFVYPDEITGSQRLPAPIRNRLNEVAMDFNGGVDYILPLGDILQSMYLVYRIAIMHGKRVDILRYDRQERAYLAVRM